MRRRSRSKPSGILSQLQYGEIDENTGLDLSLRQADQSLLCERVKDVYTAAVPVASRKQGSI